MSKPVLSDYQKAVAKGMSESQLQAAIMTEKELQEAIIEAAGYLGYRHYHTYDSRRSVAGFPDLILLRERDGRRFAIECKTQKGKASAVQMAWLATFSACGIPALIVRPNDLDTLLKTLR